MRRITTDLATNLPGLANFAIYFGIAVLLLVIFAFLYAQVTPYSEFALIAEAIRQRIQPHRYANRLCPAPGQRHLPQHQPGLHCPVGPGRPARADHHLPRRPVDLSQDRCRDIPANKISKGIFPGAVSIAVGILNAVCRIY
ncbi:MAG: hypothetical protein ACOY4H_03355 [Thermodesulfobacteriota bacterium]